MILTKLFEGIFWLFYNLVSLATNILLFPIILLIKPIIPDISTYIGQAGEFFNDKVFLHVKFVRELFFNITGASRALFSLLISFWLGLLTLSISIRTYKLIRNIWSLIKKGD